MKQRHYKYIVPILLGTLFSCQKSSNTEDFNQIVEGNPIETEVDVSSEIAMQVIEQMPSPLEISAIIKKTGLSYNSGILNPIAHMENYTTNSQKAVNFGIYATDLGYVNMYNSSQDAMNYLETVSSLSQDLNVSHFFNFELLQKLATNEQNLDSLMHISTQNFEEINDYLAKSQRGDLGALIIAGGWIEGMYLACEVHQKSDHKSLREKIGDQKVSLSSLISLMNAYKSNPDVELINKDLMKLQNIFNKIQVKEHTRESKVIEEDGIPMYQDKKVLTVMVTDEEINQIRTLVIDLRNRLVK
jgi:hypothetical protein